MLLGFMQIVSALCYLLIVAFYVALWVIGLTLLIIGCIRKKRVLKIVGSLFIFPALAITAMYFWGEYRANSPRYVYEETFHEELPPDVVPLFGKDTGNWASDGIELRVKASPATFDRLLQRIQAESKPELSRFTLEEFKQSGASIYASRPAEMELPKEDSEIYVSNERFGAEYVEFTYNPDTQIIQFYWYDDY